MLELKVELLKKLHKEFRKLCYLPQIFPINLNQAVKK